VILNHGNLTYLMSRLEMLNVNASEIEVGSRVKINSPRSFEYHDLEGTVRHIYLDKNGKKKYDIRMDWGAFKTFSERSLKLT
jgi:hypothetical protein